MHSCFSEDGSSTLEQMCQQAILLGIPEIGFSEHWDVGPYEQNPYFFKPEAWEAELERLRLLFAGRLVIRAGLEVAEPHLYASQAASVLQRASFDYVIGSVHWVGPHFMFDERYIHQHTSIEIFSSYFLELEKMVSRADIDIVAHLDIPARTVIPIHGYDPACHEEQVRKILQVIIDRGLALDINTAGKRKPSRNLMPDPLILKWYAEMGGNRVTLGSDAHQANQVGLHLDQAVEAIRSVGLAHLTCFDHHEPSLIPL